MRNIVATPEGKRPGYSFVEWKQYSAEMLEEDRPSDEYIEERIVPPLCACLDDRIPENADVAILDAPKRTRGDDLIYSRLHIYNGVPVRIVCLYMDPMKFHDPEQAGKFKIRADAIYDAVTKSD